MSRKEMAIKIWNACDTMRTDAGTTGILEYIEQLSWMIFLKILEIIEIRNENKAAFDGKPYSPILDEKFRWSSWANKHDKAIEEYFTTNELSSLRTRNEHVLLAFFDTKLFPYLQSLRGNSQKEKIAGIFQEIRGNRMKSASNLKAVIADIDVIDFEDSEDSHILSQIYEELLIRLGREGGVAGEFYTPRPIVKLMVDIVNPRIGGTVFDPFCGSCGFIVESFNHMKTSKELTIQEYKTLQENTFHAQEKKPLPYLIGTMNCILHELFNPMLIRTNTLEENIRNLTEDRRHDFILTNPPFGGKEGRQVQRNFQYPSSKTEILALQYVMKKLKSNGRCGIVIPEGILTNTSTKAFVNTRKDLVENYNVHAIVSLPVGIFANVSPSGQGPKTNLVFFEKDGPTESILYYDFTGYSEDVLKKTYTRGNLVSDNDLLPIVETLGNREESEWSWIVSKEQIEEDNYNLSTINPNRKYGPDYQHPEEILTTITKTAKQLIDTSKNLVTQLGGKPETPSGLEWKFVRMGDLVESVKPGFACAKRNEIQDGIPHLRPHNIRIGETTLKSVVRLPEELVDLDTYSLTIGDILFNNTNSQELVGRAAFVREPMLCGFSNHITRIRVNKSIVDSRWLTYALNYLWLSGHFSRVCTRWIGQAGVNSDTLKSSKIPIPYINDKPDLVFQKKYADWFDNIFSAQKALIALHVQEGIDLDDIHKAALSHTFSKLN